MSLTNSSPESAAQAARKASRIIATLPNSTRDVALKSIHSALQSSKDEILAANAKDMSLAQSSLSSTNNSILKRLDLSGAGKYDSMLEGITSVLSLPDPIGVVDLETRLPNGLLLTRQTCPIGVLLIIFEARPEVIVNITALALKSGNAAILKGGKESTHSFTTIANVISSALSKTEIPNDAIQLVITRDAVGPLLKLNREIDLVIPRGSNELVKYCQQNARMPVLGHADGLCSIYLHSDAAEDIAIPVVLDSKINYPAACNAVETLLVHESLLETLWPRIADALLKHNVKLKCDERSRLALPRSESVLSSEPADYETEFLELTLAIKTVTSDSEAVEWINTHGSHHTDCIITNVKAVADMFMGSVDSACAFWNCSTRFADGGRFGFGTEVGISTNKIHARGPVGLEGLMIYEYRLRGEGQTVGRY
ncbi:gamma-glutamyl phosphate reductase [Piedraia hortae CBS 480.64]|uniref:glutamate-5-semialdehyde dehydrogenase n=1 Tax=Piedraia hortae CBS 480.64 TaxID=1314780 RepID=A0A6A7BWE9_9PEZI|nr:gamma-glutamyl phosphate reductase [Piedraia hortae CBS 480.64]